ncbi:hypothetical protein F5144DRAFT_570665 [Chaetomium tenue]|uniref:Uncharacterized protein n=1 Tax=Chaetomium tenue TaxID=1854479 RepID=A0ACB7P847_9PEZI|nr:hypothetical protein F5144DRAFT_570665 [Chaetomium globosum]
MSAVMEESLNGCSSDPNAVVWCPDDTLMADPDIAGIGVISSFIASSCLAIIGTCLYLALIRSGLVPDGSFDPADGRGRSPPPADGSFNLVDRWVRQHICTPSVRFVLRARWIDDRIDRIRRTLFSFVMSLADMQLVTGVAMLTAAVIKLQRGSITVYHFSMVTNLAWFSSNVHLLALLAIRTEHIGSLKKGRRWLPSTSQTGLSMSRRARSAFSRGGDIIARIVAMLTLAALLLYCSYVSGAKGWGDNYNCPAACATGKEKGGSPLAWMVVNFMLVLLTYPQRCLALWPAVGEWWIDKARHRIVDYQGLPGTDRDRRLNSQRKVFAWVWYVVSSETMEVAVDGFLWFALGVYWTFDDRNSMHRGWKDYSDIEKENDVEGFGQLVPLLLLGLPFLQILETYCAESREAQREHQELNAPEIGLREFSRTRLNARTI